MHRLGRTLDDEDGRERLARRLTSSWPYCLSGHLAFLSETDTPFGGSCVLVGPYHVLTAAHCVYFNADKTPGSRRNWAKNMQVYFALHDTDAPFGVVDVVGAYVYQQWINSIPGENPPESGDLNYDIALLTLSRPIGKEIGYAGLMSLDTDGLQGLTIEVTGYPSDKGFNQMWTMEHIVRHFTDERMFYNIDTVGGQSGSPIWIRKNGKPYVVGIHTTGTLVEFNEHNPDNPDRRNSGVRLSQRKFRKIIEWMSERGELPPPISAELMKEWYGKAKSEWSAFQSLCDAANKGHAHAQFYLGHIYLHDSGPVGKNINEAVRFYKLASEQKLASASFNLGLHYHLGDGRDADEALKYYYLSVEQGYPCARGNINQLIEGRAQLKAMREDMARRTVGNTIVYGEPGGCSVM